MGKVDKQKKKIFQYDEKMLFFLVALIIAGVSWNLVAPPDDGLDDLDAKSFFMDMKNIKVNLADEKYFLNCIIQLELSTKADQVQLKSGLDAAKLRDETLTVLASKTYNDIRSPLGKYTLKSDLRFHINKALGGKPVKRVYFKSFELQ